MEQNRDHQDPYRVEAVDRALQLLTLLSQQSGLSVTDAAKYLGVAPSTAHRLLTTMAARGYVAQGERRLYRVGPAMLAAGAATRSTAAVVARLRPVLGALHQDVGETVHLQVLVGADSQFVDGIEGPQALRVGLRTGSRIPAYCTSGGKAMLAALPPSTVAALHSEGLRPWPSRRLTSLNGLCAELREVRARGYAVNAEESEAGVLAIGLAVGSEVAGPDPVASISVAIPTARVGEATRHVTIARLRKAAGDADRLLRAG